MEFAKSVFEAKKLVFDKPFNAIYLIAQGLEWKQNIPSEAKMQANSLEAPSEYLIESIRKSEFSKNQKTPIIVGCITEIESETIKLESNGFIKSPYYTLDLEKALEIILKQSA